MPPVPVHIEDPISPTQGRVPESQVQTHLEPSTNTPAYNPATTTTATAASTYTQSNIPARAGAAAFPAPTTPAARPYPTPTRTHPQQTTSDLPPPPQPGQAPSLANAAVFHANATASLTSQPPSSIAPPHPAQAQIPPPQQNLAPTHTTEPYTPRHGGGGSTTLNLGPVITPSAQHPPGYVQDAYAQELNSAQRASLDVQQQRERQEEGGLLGTPSKSGSVAAPESVGEAWDTVKSWSGDAGRKMSQLAGEAHDGVWKWINKES